MDDSENVMEILLRLVRGDRSTPFSANANQSLSLTNLSGPLLTALRPNAAHSAQQTHVSLAVLAMFQMAVDFAKEARHEHGLKDAQEKMGEIIRCLPSHLLYKSLDGIFKEWKVERKGGR
jgi:20S proteasome subunit alpha 6